MHINNPLVSIIMPTYNKADFICESLDSILSQSYANWECIVVDDGSTDETFEKVQKYLAADKRFSYYKKENKGAGNARNYGIKRSEGFYILPLDSDDLIAENYIEKAVNEFRVNNKLKLVYCECKLFGEQNEKWMLPPYSYKSMLIYNMIFNAAMYKRSDYDQTKGYDESTTLEDWDFWIKLLGANDLVYQIPEILFYYRTHKKGSITNEIRTNDKQYLKSINILYKNNIDTYLNFIGNPIELERERRELASKVNSANYKLGMKIVNHKLFKFIRSIYSLVKGNKWSN